MAATEAQAAIVYPSSGIKTIEQLISYIKSFASGGRIVRVAFGPGVPREIVEAFEAFGFRYAATTAAPRAPCIYIFADGGALHVYSIVADGVDLAVMVLPLSRAVQQAKALIRKRKLKPLKERG